MQEFFDGLWMILREIGLNDILDILIVAYIIYKLVIFIRDSRAQLAIKAIIIIAVAYLIAALLKLQMVSYIIDLIVRNAAVCLIVIFQPELRSLLERVGRSRLSVSSLFTKDSDAALRTETLGTISSVVESARVLKDRCMGALIVFETKVKLDDIINTGISMDVSPNVSIITNIFFDKAPLHDGAMIIRGNRICAASCYLPLTHRTDIDSNLGTRHRAAIGLSEICDAVIVVVSEETGRFTVCQNGDFTSTFDLAELSTELVSRLVPEDPDEKDTDAGSFGSRFVKSIRRTKLGARLLGGEAASAQKEVDD